MTKYKLELILTAIIVAVFLLASCERDEKIVCTKTVTVYYNGVEQSVDVSKVMSLKGSERITDTKYNGLDEVTTTITEIDCGCD